MAKNTPVAIFMAATALLSTNLFHQESGITGERNQGMGGLKEWTTDQDIKEESTLDKDAKKAEFGMKKAAKAAKKAAKKAKEKDICIPVGEGENCW